MIATLIIVLGGSLAAVYNYILRRNSNSPQAVQNFVIYVLLCSFLVSLAFESGFQFSWVILGLAAFAGLAVSLIFYSLPKAFAAGPSGLSLAIFSSACILPPMVMTLIFGCSCGFIYKLAHFIGALLVVFGLFFSALKGPAKGVNRRWLSYTLLAFVGQVFVLTIYQYKALLAKPELPEHPLVTAFSLNGFFPALFLSAIIFSLILKSHPLIFSKTILVQALIGGLLNTLGALLLVFGLSVATPIEVPLLVPINSMTTIILCNLWSQKLFHEKINWLGNSIALAGILISFIEF